MKTSKILSLAVAVTMALVAGKALALNTNSIPVLNISGTLDEVKTNYTTSNGKNNIQTTKTVSFNNAFIMSMLTTALANHQPSNMAPVTVPAKSYLVFNPNAPDTNSIWGISGVFYITNSSTHFHFQLSGIDGNGAYYSYAEFDSEDDGYDLGSEDLNNDLDDFTEVNAYNDSTVTNTATSSSAETAVLYIHDNPYAYDAADVWAWWYGNGSNPILCSPNPSSSLANYENSIEIQGLLKTTSNTTDKGITTSSGTLTGIGNALINGNDTVILSAKMTVTGIVSVGN